MARDTRGDAAYEAMMRSRDVRDTALGGVTDPRRRKVVNARHGKSVQLLMKTHNKMMKGSE